MPVYFTSDTHFGHGGALGLFRRPFASVAAMDEALVERWNAVIHQGDEVWHLGDFALGRSAVAMAALLDRLHGTKHLIAGNNDGPETRSLAGWSSVADYAELRLDDRLVVLSHYPFRAWNGMGRGAIDLHGHSHGKLAPVPRQFDVGVDVHGFAPVTLEQILVSRRRRKSDAGLGIEA